MLTAYFRPASWLLLRLLVVLGLLLPQLVLASPQVVFVNPAKHGEAFWDNVSSSMLAAAEELDFQLEIVYSDRDGERMNQHTRSLLAEKNIDYLVLVNEEGAVLPSVRAALSQKVHILLLLNDLTEVQKQLLIREGFDLSGLLTVIPDNYTTGYQMMLQLQRCAIRLSMPATSPLPVLMIGGDKLTPASTARNQGALDYLAQQSWLQLDRFFYADWSQEQSYKLVSRRLEHLAETAVPKLIWSANDPIALGAVKAYSEKGVIAGKEACFVGLNWSSEILKEVISGSIESSFGGHFLAGGLAMVLIKDHLAGSSQLSMEFDMFALDKSNALRYLTLYGDAPWQRIAFSQFLLANRVTYPSLSATLLPPIDK